MTERSRTFTWSDPGQTASKARERAGLDFLEAVAAGELPAPPIADALGMRLVSVDSGSVAFTLDPAEFHYNPIGSVHGGVHATLLDSAAGCAVHSTLPAGTGCTSLDLAVRFVRPITTDTGTITCVGTVVHRGRRTAIAEARLVDGAGRLLATATSTCLIQEAKS
ncbi:PaaI family thioesterase [Lentzea sp. NBRC 102530]|uniref:PaaI family thioesterase n=1 Tax=Lentzea sp. NBRC 102530 TaxID=3032201 RepID=UPI0024A1F608|nr:PaaI family thioesterase [Lentzea sp. NBRC 102530]GLY50231.1 phenylacetic acid degradation protein [Lentzea sp. NBRC 102530]